MIVRFFIVEFSRRVVFYERFFFAGGGVLLGHGVGGSSLLRGSLLRREAYRDGLHDYSVGLSGVADWLFGPGLVVGYR
jgi:hypothetical protein